MIYSHCLPFPSHITRYLLFEVKVQQVFLCYSRVKVLGRSIWFWERGYLPTLELLYWNSLQIGRMFRYWVTKNERYPSQEISEKNIYLAPQGRRKSYMIMICEIHWAMF